MPCVICTSGDQPCCYNCWPSVELTRSSLDGLPKYSAADYRQLSPFILPFKDHSLMSMTRVLAPLATSALNAIDADLRVALAVREDLPLTVVFPPSSRANMRKRGFNPTERILRLAADQRRFQVRAAFKWARGVSDQGSLSKDGRIQNLAESMIATHSNLEQVLIFDDVTATGSTLREMRRALEKNGNRVVGYCVLAESFLISTPQSVG